MMKRILLRLLRKLGLQNYLNYKLSIKKSGQEFVIPLRGTTGINHFFDSEEEWMYSIISSLNRLSQKKGVFVDVGVNIGQTLLKVKAIRADWQYFGFEPNPHCINYVNELVELNNLSDVIFFPFALGNKTTLGELQLFENDRTDSTASIVNGFRKNAIKKSPVMIVDGKEIEILRNVSVIKIDVEGGELEVLAGLAHLLQNDIPYVICEVLPVYSNNKFRLDRQLELERLLHKFDYLKLRVQESSKLHLIKEIGLNADLNNATNYLFVPRVKFTALREAFEIYE